MHFERLRTSGDQSYKKSMELYNISFPFHEQRKPSLQAEIMDHEEYQFNLIRDQGGTVGILLCWETEAFIYVEHFCIRPEMRNKKYGQRALDLLGRRKKTIILEIDPPVDEVSIHRKAFYERAGYMANEFEHIHPPYHEEYPGHRLVVMSYPQQLTKAGYYSFNQYLRAVVMEH